MSLGYLTDTMRADYDAALDQQFWSFARPFQLYLNQQQAVISTSPTYSRFGDHSQNAAITADNTAVVPQVYTVTGCILYGNQQPWPYVEPGSRGNWHQDKIRESEGIVRIKVEVSGQALLSQCKNVSIDGFNFTLNSNARPHGLAGLPKRWTYTLQKVD